MACFISAVTGGNSEESEEERWHAQVCSDQREPGSEDDASADKAVLCAFLVESGQGLILGYLRRNDFGSHRLELKEFYLLLYGPCPK